MFLDDEKINAILMDYVQNDKTHQAILIDGEWGSGKTFFIQNVFMENYKKLQQPKKLYYLSLYGVKDFKQIENDLREKMLENYIATNVHVDAAKAVRYIPKLASVILQKAGIGSEDKIKEIVDEFQPITDMILIFDDLERCNININELLGYINNLVEHNSVKAIILANEREIWRSGFSVDIASKYNTAIAHLKMIGYDNKNKDVDDVKRIQEHAEAIFSQDNGYEKIKEKLIGLRIRYNKPLRTSYDSVLNIIVDDNDTADFLKSSSNIILNQFNGRKNTNIRTMVAVFANFQKINKLAQRVQSKFRDFVESVKVSMLDYLTWCTLEVKTGGSLDPWEDKEDFSKHIVITLSDGRRIIYGYRFVHELVTYGYIDEEEFVREFEKYAAKAGKNAAYSRFIENESALSDLFNWQLLEDEEIVKVLEKLEVELIEKKYQFSSFGQIIYILVDLSRHGFSVDFDSYLKPIRKYVEQEDSGYISLSGFRTFGNDEANKLFRELADSINKLVEKKNNAKQIAKYNYLDTDNWDASFIMQCQENSNNFLIANKFFAYFNIDSFKKKMKQATAKDVYYFLGAIKQVYNFSNLRDCYSGDADNLRKMLAITEEVLHDTQKISLKNNLIMLCAEMEEYLKRLEPKQIN